MGMTFPNESTAYRAARDELLGMEWDNHPRHMDPAWPLWTFLDWSPGGRGDFFPALDYD